MPCCPPRPDSWVATALKPPGLLVFLAHKRNNPYRFTTGLRLHVSLDCGASSLNAPPKQLPDGASEPTREALLAALAERDRELAEVRARQTATAEILRVISQSPADAQPVFESIVLTAVRLLGCGLAAVLLCDGGSFYPVAEASRAGVHTSKMGKTPIDPGDNFPSRAIVAKEKLYLPDWSRIDLPGHERRVREIMGVNSALYLPLLRRGECFGLLALIGERADMFGPSEIALAEAFRDQAGIAIENTRQFNETKEALEQQTATAEILKVIAGSPSDGVRGDRDQRRSAGRRPVGRGLALRRRGGLLGGVHACQPGRGRGAEGAVPDAFRELPNFCAVARWRGGGCRRHRDGCDASR
jgi:GAF domain-containing protein